MESKDGFHIKHIFLDETLRNGWICMLSIVPMGFAKIIGGKSSTLLRNPSHW